MRHRHIYLAARFHRQALMREIRAKLADRGHFVTARWLDEVASGNTEDQLPLDHRRQIALDDLHDLEEADTIVLFTDDVVGGKGMWVEYGYALGRDKWIIRVGPESGVFSTLISEIYPSIDDFVSKSDLFVQLCS